MLMIQKQVIKQIKKKEDISFFKKKVMLYRARKINL